MQHIRIRSFIIGGYPIRGFLAWGEEDREALFVDPGGWDDGIAETLDAFNLTLSAIALTHGHWDHTGGLEEMVEKCGAAVYAHAGDVHLLKAPPNQVLEGGEQLTCGSVKWQVLHTPGHTAGSVAYTIDGVVFTGDTLFAGAIGGTPSLAEYERERLHIREFLFPLGDATRVYPAHGPATTIGIERRCNPFLR
ncbi:MAG: MBL fold metallo-hydrolase [Armatimonadota bacterium]